jgi:hypothetical protein
MKTIMTSIMVQPKSLKRKCKKYTNFIIEYSPDFEKGLGKHIYNLIYNPNC